jgi:hypothetical protein
MGLTEVPPQAMVGGVSTDEDVVARATKGPDGLLTKVRGVTLALASSHELKPADQALSWK